MRIIVKALILCMVFLVFACISQRPHYYYQQSPPEVSLFKEKHEARLSGAVIVGPTMNGKGIKGAFSLTDKFMVAAGWNDFKNNREDFVNGISTGSWSGNYFETAFGYYKGHQELGILECYAGYGHGSEYHKYTSVTEEYDAFLFIPVVTYTATEIGSASLKYNKLFVQPSYGISIKHSVDLALYTRISALDFYEVKNNITSGYQDYNNVQTIQRERISFMIEPGITFRAGYKYVKFQLQAGLTAGSASFKYDDYFISTGLQFEFAKRYMKSRSPDINAIQAP
jgi:hypothetical protein